MPDLRPASDPAPWSARGRSFAPLSALITPPTGDNVVPRCNPEVVRRLRIRPGVLGRPVGDIEALYRDALTLLNTSEAASRPDLAQIAQAVDLVVNWLTGTEDIGIDHSIPCPPRDRSDLERQTQAMHGLFRRIGTSDEPASELVFNVWQVLGYALTPRSHYPLSRALYRVPTRTERPPQHA
jgi:hypothetical protein